MNIILLTLTLVFSLGYITIFRKNTLEGLILKISRVFIGFVFAYSGFVKAIDPLGSTYKFTDYFNAFAMEQFIPFAFLLSVILSSLEFLIGVMLIFNIKPKTAVVLAFLFMVFFTPLTFILALYNPVSDCGCFGDALVLTNWQTFWKNLVILMPTIILVFKFKKLKGIFNRKIEIIEIGSIVILIATLSVYCYRHLPIIDFRPYKIGNNITALRKEFVDLDEKIAEDKAIIDKTPFDEREYKVENYYVYEKNGVEKEFKEIPDSTWKWKETKTITISEGYKPPIHDFTISNNTDGDITNLVLNDTNYVLLIISYKIKNANLQGVENATKLAIDCAKNGVKSYFLTASIDEDVSIISNKIVNNLKLKKLKQEIIETQKIYYYEKNGEIAEFKENEIPKDNSWELIGEEEMKNPKIAEKSALPFSFYFTDEITLKTIVRANPGVVLLKKGTVINKWHFNDVPKMFNTESIPNSFWSPIEIGLNSYCIGIIQFIY